MSLNEKNIEKVESASSREDEDELDLTLHDPKAEDTLHRGLKARQISMIAVSPKGYLTRSIPAHNICALLARWCSWNGPYHWFWYRASTRWTAGPIARLLLRWFRLLPRHGVSRRDGRLPAPQERFRWLCNPVC